MIQHPQEREDEKNKCMKQIRVMSWTNLHTKSVGYSKGIRSYLEIGLLSLGSSPHIKKVHI